MQVFEESGAALQSLRVLAVLQGNAGQQALDPRDLRSTEFRVFEVDVVHDLADGTKAGVVEPKLLDQDLERAAVPLVRELRFEHVEAGLARRRAVPLDGDELEPGPGVDEPPDEPGAGHSI